MTKKASGIPRDQLPAASEVVGLVRRVREDVLDEEEEDELLALQEEALPDDELNPETEATRVSSVLGRRSCSGRRR
eukprot:7915270-Pyramimonas_sp.AAC.1